MWKGRTYTFLMTVTNAVFGELARNRKRAADAAKGWGVYSVNKSGALSKHPPVLCSSEEEAVKKAEYLESINPGRKFVAKEIAR